MRTAGAHRYDRCRRRDRRGRTEEGFPGNVAEVTIGESESLDAALRRFNKRVQSEGILTAARRHEYYEKPSEKRKKKEAARRRKLRKSIIKAQKRREFF
jgi:small subunit ribosomal protein S21